MPDLRERWRSRWFQWLHAAVYDSVVEDERLARVLGRLLWGVDADMLYRDIARLAGEPDGSAILDIPCGGGIALRGLRPDQRLRYVASDLSPVMLRRARAEAGRRGLDWIELVEADVEALPFADGTFDLCVSYTGLHCFPDPAAALREIGRVLRSGGELRGSCVARGSGVRQDALVHLGQMAGVFGPCATLAELESWLAGAGLVAIDTARDGALAYFSARRS
ncbi:MAG: class I SAM-dependent methyltransferase [Actinomycetota bacterium]|nr:class I SAM-dependent methyltransferase [Actinomycetota bacterium]